MQVNVAGLRRAAKNIAHNYTDPQKKVREATSNDPWGPSSTIMSEIADLTYNIEAFAQIMEMLWKRLNDSGKKLETCLQISRSFGVSYKNWF
jgi:epsin